MNLKQIISYIFKNQLATFSSASERLVLQRKPFAFELFFCLANAVFFTFSSNTCSIVPTWNLCWNIQRRKNQFYQ